MFKNKLCYFLLLFLLLILSSCGEYTPMEQRLKDENKQLETQIKELKDENEKLSNEIAKKDVTIDELQFSLDETEILNLPEDEYIQSYTGQLNGYNISFDIKQNARVYEGDGGIMIIKNEKSLAAISIEYANNLTAFRYVQNEIDYLKNNVGSENLTVKSRNELTINNSTGYEAVLQTPDEIYKYIAVRVRDDYLIIYFDNEGGNLMQEQVELAATICSTIKVSAASSVRPQSKNKIITSPQITQAPKINISDAVKTSAPIKNERIVYRGKTGTKYHKKNCPTLKGGGIPITINDALKQNREPCKVCGG